MLWMQMYIAVALSLWGNVIVKHDFLDFFAKIIIVEYLNLFFQAISGC